MEGTLAAADFPEAGIRVTHRAITRGWVTARMPIMVRATDIILAAAAIRFIPVTVTATMAGTVTTAILTTATFRSAATGRRTILPTPFTRR